MDIASYHAPISEFLVADSDAIFGKLNFFGAAEDKQKNAWIEQIEIMRQSVNDFPHGHILFEFIIRRIGKRADVILVIGGVIIVLEFKMSDSFERSAIEQVHDYALDLKNFHGGSHDLPIVPILVATRANPTEEQSLSMDDYNVSRPLKTDTTQLRNLIAKVVSDTSNSSINYDKWFKSIYRPTPTIVEAARVLYVSHNVNEITRSDAGAKNLRTTSNKISEIIDYSKAHNKKSICLVTGVPGAGKTLAGLDISIKYGERAVFLSGNGPLVSVLQEALIRDKYDRDKETGKKPKKGHIKSEVTKFIQAIHHFRDDAILNSEPICERVVIFDEAQRVWTRDRVVKFMREKRKSSNLNVSEPEFLISVMDRHKDWCVIICLIGGGQEINTGDAGLYEWLSALQEKFKNWDVYISKQLPSADYVNDEITSNLLKEMSVNESEELHLSVSMRSFRAVELSSLVNHIVENRPAKARDVYARISDRYPIYLTRNLDDARQWLKNRSRGSERFGLLASSRGLRLRTEGLSIKPEVDATKWFLNDRTDIRSSFYCEEAATEFKVQGLELDWAGICWDADYRYKGDCWGYYNFSGTRWQRIKNPEKQIYKKNAYRVLLTRARQGMIIFVPEGAHDDPTRSPEYHDQTFEYLQQCGLKSLKNVK